MTSTLLSDKGFKCQIGQTFTFVFGLCLYTIYVSPAYGLVLVLFSQMVIICVNFLGRHSSNIISCTDVLVELCHF